MQNKYIAQYMVDDVSLLWDLLALTRYLYPFIFYIAFLTVKVYTCQAWYGYKEMHWLYLKKEKEKEKYTKITIEEELLVIFFIVKKKRFCLPIWLVLIIEKKQTLR